jgi:hypothetical protein
MTEYTYKNDGFNLEDLQVEAIENYYIIVDLEELKIKGIYTKEQLVEDEVARLKNFDDNVTLVMSFKAAAVDTPMEF